MVYPRTPQRGLQRAGDIGMSTPAAVAQRALDDAQTAALLGMDMEMLKIILSALKYIADGCKGPSKRWGGLRKDY